MSIPASGTCPWLNLAVYEEVTTDGIQSPGGVNMKKTVCSMALVLGWVVSAQATTVYLNDGGTISARNVWREKGKVVVLVNRDSITSFSVSEINMKKTFPPRRKPVKPATPVAAVPVSGKPSQGAVVQATAPAPAKPEKESKKFSLPSLPNKLPEREIPKGSEEGAIRKQKHEMAERLKE